MSRKIILSLSERLSKVSESILLAFFVCLDYIRSNRPACVAVNKNKNASRLRTFDGMFFSVCCFGGKNYVDMHCSLILVSGDYFDLPYRIGVLSFDILIIVTLMF